MGADLHDARGKAQSSGGLGCEVRLRVLGVERFRGLGLGGCMGFGLGAEL